MLYSRPLKSSAHSLPSPDGAFIATVLPSKLVIRRVRSLTIEREIPLSINLTTNTRWFIWSTTSDRILVGNDDQLHVYSVSNQHFHGAITNPSSGTARITHVAFGIDQDEVLVFLEFGMKLVIFQLNAGKSIEIACPKFFGPNTAVQAYAYRPRSRQFALLSRGGGKDVISIHAKHTYEVVRSWNPETVDAQELNWSPDGKWLSVVESAGQGYRILVHTADGHVYKVLRAPGSNDDEDADDDLGAGARSMTWMADGEHLAIGDHTSRISILSVPSFSESIRLSHDTTIKPTTSTQVWQEQISQSSARVFDRSYTSTSQLTCPPSTSIPNATESSIIKFGTAKMSVDASGTLLATIADHMPTTLWIWDIGSKLVKAILIQHAPVAKITWHSVVAGLLMIRCEGEDSRGLASFWMSSWNAPRIIDFGSTVPEGKLIGKTIIRWLGSDSQFPAVFFTDSQDCILASWTDDELEAPWTDRDSELLNTSRELRESPQHPASSERKSAFTSNVSSVICDESDLTWGSAEDMNDTFQFKNFRT